jgi:hypothetical protein
MYPETQILAIVPILAAVAVGDSAAHLSTWVSRRIGIANAIWVHIVILSAAMSALLTSVYSRPDVGQALAIVDYVRAEDAWARHITELRFLIS